MVIAGVLLPCLPAVINVAFGYGIMSFSPMVCFLAVQDVGFYADALVEGVTVAILGTMQALVLLKLTKVCITTVSRCITGFQFYVGLLCICEKINFFCVILVLYCVCFYLHLLTYIYSMLYKSTQRRSEIRKSYPWHTERFLCFYY